MSQVSLQTPFWFRRDFYLPHSYLWLYAQENTQDTPLYAVRNGQLLMFRCPGTSSPAVCRIRFSIVSLWCRLLSFCYITEDMESRSQWECSAKHDGTTRAHPDNRKMKVINFFPALSAERPSLRTSIHCLQQWLYHSKIPHTGAVYCFSMLYGKSEHLVSMEI